MCFHVSSDPRRLLGIHGWGQGQDCLVAVYKGDAAPSTTIACRALIQYADSCSSVLFDLFIFSLVNNYVAHGLCQWRVLTTVPR